MQQLPLLEFHYWTDVVMWGLIALDLLCIAILVVCYKIYKRPSAILISDADEAKLLQEIYDSLLKSKADLESTIT